MFFIFEIIYIHSSPNFFQTIREKEYEHFLNSIFSKMFENSLLYYDKFHITKVLSQREENLWTYTMRIHGFKTVDAINIFMNFYGDSTDSIRLQRTAWNTGNQITGEFNILNHDGNVIKVHTNCQTGACYGNPTGCDKKLGGPCYTSASKAIIERKNKIFHIAPIK
jgi:hypothetical protein